MTSNNEAMPGLMRAGLNAFFSVMLAPLLIFPGFAASRLVRKSIEILFGKLLAGRYAKVISAYGSAYGVALSRGLEAGLKLAQRPLRLAIDCGTGTGFVTLTLAQKLPELRIISVDAVPAMLQQAREKFVSAGIDATTVCGDISRLPFPDGHADLVVAQNTTPFLAEFARVCAPGGIVLFVDSSAGFISSIAAKAMLQTGMLTDIQTASEASGFFVVGRRISR